MDLMNDLCSKAEQKKLHVGIRLSEDAITGADELWLVVVNPRMKKDICRQIFDLDDPDYSVQNTLEFLTLET